MMYVQARYVISAMPQALLNRVAFVPALLPEKVQLIQRMPMGQACKTMIFYDKPYWRDLGMIKIILCEMKICIEL